MGCWNGTCQLSNLPIFCGDEIVTILLINTGMEGDGLSYYPQDKYVPLGYPLYGTYDDYGSMENIENLDKQLEFLKSLDIYKIQKEDKYEKFNIENIEDFIRDILTCNEIYFVKSHNYYSEYKEINFMTIHRELYDNLINEISNRKTIANDDLSLKEKTIIKIEKTINDKKEKENKYKNMDEATRRLLSDRQPLSHTIGFIDSINPHMTYDYFLDKLYDSWDNEILNTLLNIVMFDRVLSFMRSGYLISSGLGSQSQEMYLQRILAQFIFDYTDKHKNDYLEENVLDESQTEDDILKEPIYFFD